MTLPHRFVVLLSVGLIALLAGCVTPGDQKPAADNPAERQLALGLKAYDEGQYPEAERALNEALRLKLSTPKDKASAYKTLAFVYCSSGRTAECGQAFKSARAADPTFSLSKAEASHPVWGPVYERSRN